MKKSLDRLEKYFPPDHRAMDMNEHISSVDIHVRIATDVFEGKFLGGRFGVV